MKLENKLSSEMKATNMGEKEEREESRKRKGEMEKEGIERRRKSRWGICSKNIVYLCENVFMEPRTMFSQYILIKRQEH